MTLEERLGSHVSSGSRSAWMKGLLRAKQEASIFNKGILADTFVDDGKFTRTKEYTWTVQFLRLLHHSLVNLLESWHRFQSGEVRYFRVRENDDLDKRCRSHLAKIDKEITELRFLRRSIQQRIEVFDNMRNGVSY